MPGTIGQQAVVIGAGMGGLAAAKAVAPSFERVIVLDRDALPEEASPRLGTPQARHVHVLLAGGERALNELFAGVSADFAGAGAVTLRAARDLLVERPGYDPFPRRDLGVDLVSLTRPTLERVCRRRLEQDPKVEIRSRARVAELVPSSDGRAVEGLRYENAAGSVQELAADLVVDASGRAIPTLSFLERVGRPKPEQTEIGVDVAYSSAVFELSAGARDWFGLMHIGTPPNDGRGAFVLPIEGGRWLVSVGRCPSGEMPADIESLIAFTKTLRTQTVHEAVRSAKPLTDVARYGLRASVRRHFDRLDDWPQGLVPIADSICRFNPLFGQGMSVAAMEAAVLGKLLAERAGSSDPLAGLGREFLTRIQDLLASPWGVAVSDLAYAHTTGDRPSDLGERLAYSQAIVRLAAEDAEAHELMIEVAHLIKPPSALREPPFRDRIMALMTAAA